MSDNVTYPVAAGTVLETKDIGGGVQRPAHRAPESDAILTAISGKLPASLGPKTAAASVSLAPATDAVFPPPADQDPIFNHAAGVKVAVTASAVVLTPPAGCKYVRISCDADVVVNTAGVAAADDGSAIRLVANAPEVIPVVAGTPVYALSLSGAAAVVRATPMKVRS